MGSVRFTNIRVEGDWIYADAYDVDYKVSGHIKVHKTEELFETDCKEFNRFQQAAWAMRKKLARGKIKDNICAIVWG